MKQGTVAFKIHHDNPQWSFDDAEYRFEFHEHGVDILVTKRPDKTLSVETGGHPGLQQFHQPVPKGIDPDVHLVLTWTPKEVKLYLNGVPVETKRRGK